MVSMEPQRTHIHFDGLCNMFGALCTKIILGEVEGRQRPVTTNIIGAGNKNAKTLADAISANGALTSLNLSRNNLCAEGAKHVAEAIKEHVSALQFFWYHFELDLTSGSTAVVYGYSYYNTTKGALATLDIRNNSIPSDQKANLRRICKSKNTNLKL